VEFSRCDRQGRWVTLLGICCRCLSNYRVQRAVGVGFGEGLTLPLAHRR
jgi:hypothetical protein